MAEGISHVEQLEAQGSAWSYLLVGLCFFAVIVGGGWYAAHGGPALLKVWRRGADYRARLRAARHAAPARPLIPRQRVSR